MSNYLHFILTSALIKLHIRWCNSSRNSSRSGALSFSTDCRDSFDMQARMNSGDRTPFEFSFGRSGFNVISEKKIARRTLSQKWPPLPLQSLPGLAKMRIGICFLFCIESPSEVAHLVVTSRKRFLYWILKLPWFFNKQHEKQLK